VREGGCALSRILCSKSGRCSCGVEKFAAKSQHLPVQSTSEGFRLRFGPVRHPKWVMIEAPNITESQAVSDFLADRSEESFAALFEILYPKVLRYFVLRGAAPGLAEELSQDVLTAVYRHSAALRDRQLFFGWLFRIARNQLLQHIRRNHKKDADTVALDDLDIQSIGRMQTGGSADGSIQEWLGQLEPQERQIMMLRYIEELGYQEIATALNLPLGTVKWKIFRAKAKLGKSLKTNWKGMGPYETSDD
jgi:RNA polymerase sigma factor (sigma-70 family)